LMHRIKSIDRETLKHMLSYRKDISEEDAERIISRIEMARDNVKNKVEQMQVEIKRRIEDAKVEAVHQANEVRKTAATAAWWAFATAIISGVGAVMGGIIASTTF
jgi:F0F1-type ATP synthase membrane subunit b/b'